MKKLFIRELILLFVLLLQISFAFAQKNKNKDYSNRDLLQAEHYFVEGQKYFMLEDYPKAQVLFQKSLEINPDNAAVYYKLGEIFTRQDQYEKALPYASKALQFDNSNKYYHLLNAEIYTKLSKFSEAAKIYEEMLQKIPDTEEYLFDLAALYIYQQDYEKAVSVYEKAEQEFGLNKEITYQKQKIFLKLNKLDEAVKEGEKLVDANPGEPEYVVMLADILISNNKEKEAIPYLEKLMTDSPDNPEARLLLSEVYRKTGNILKSEENLRAAFSNPDLGISSKIAILAGYLNQISDEHTKNQALDLAKRLEKAHPNEANAYAVHGDLLFALDKKIDAKDKYLKAVQLDNSNFTTWQNILQIEMEINQVDSVVKHSEEALELFPNQASLYYFSGTAYLIQKNYQEAVAAFEQGKKMSSSNLQLLQIFNSRLGDAYNGIQDYKKSDEAFDAALAHDPENDYVLNNYSYYLSLRKEKLDLAKKMSSKLVKKNPDNPTYLDTHAWVLYTLGEYKEARKFLEKAIAGDANGTIIEHYGDVLFKLGEIDLAVKQWQKAKGLDETSELIDKKIADRKLYE